MVIAFCSRAAVTVFQQAVKSFEHNRQNETYIIAESIDHCKHQIVATSGHIVVHGTRWINSRLTSI